jgi:OPA family glycerol-3-phosphate transporter-like MFS transporter
LPEQPQHDAAFRRRRGINWLTLGLTYATFYMGRYNFSVAQKSLSDEFGWSKGDVGWILTAGLWVYAISTVVNGPLTDRFGGRRVLLVGTAGAAVGNILFGLGSFFGLGAKSWLLGYLATAFAINNYFQSFGACAIVKVNAGWFQLRERGVFGGIFGAMIQGGRYLTFAVSAPLIAWLSWKWGFFLPAALLTVMFFVIWRNVQDTPVAAGLPPLDTGDDSDDVVGRVPFSYLLKRVYTNPTMLTLMAASFCIGFSRQGLDQWMARYFQEVHKLTPFSLNFQLLGSGAPLFGIAGGLIAGTASDRLFGSRRPPVIFIFFLGQLLFFGLLSQAVGPWAALGAILGASLCITACHSLIAGVASMDFGGKHAAGSAAGIIDGVQYLAGGVTGHWMGNWLERYGWGNWAYMLMPTAFAGACLMAAIWRADPRTKAVAAAA